MRFSRIVKEYFSFSKGERVGITILIMLIVIVMIADRLIFYFEKPGVADRQRFEEMIAELERQQAPVQEAATFFAFDPNTVDSTTLEALSLPFRVRQNMLKYRERGGFFRDKGDVRKIYGMNDSVYALLEPYIDIKIKTQPTAAARGLPEPKNVSPCRDSAIAVSPTSSIFRVEINRAAAADLVKLYGIGAVLSERIIKYRDLLGGFYTTEQLKEVYGLSAETFAGIANQLLVDSTALELININFAEARELANHPYLEWNDANRIIGYRDKHGFVDDKLLLLKDSVLSPEVFRKVSPYFQTERD